jgi:2-octaprenyl-6-methoxyphenol hydroxylase
MTDIPADPLPKIETDIAIVGGGLNGPALALALAQAGFDVTIIDALPIERLANPDFDGRSYALALASKRLLNAIRVWPDIADQSQPMLEIKVSDAKPGQAPSPWMLHFDHAEIEEGPMGYMVEDRFLRAAFLNAMASKPRVRLLDRERVVAQTEDGRLQLESGRAIQAKLIVGCDGRQSGTAQRAGIDRTGWSYGQTAVTCAIAHDLPHSGIAHQMFLPAGPLAILPLPGNVSSIVWSETDERAHELTQMSEPDFLAALRPVFGSFLGDISIASTRFAYPLNLTLADSFIGDRLALVGDAAHGMHPIAGQGLNAGLRDVAALVDVLKSARRRGEDIGAPQVLRRYQQWRRFDTASLALATDSFNKLFSNDNPLLRSLRDLGMGAVNALPKLRRNFIREAAGLTGDLPPLMR